MSEIAARAKTLPPPPHVVLESLREPNRDPARPWLRLTPDEVRPTISSPRPDTVRWSSLWPGRPDLTVEFHVAGDGAGGSRLRLSLHADDPAPGPEESRAFQRRLHRLIFADLRYSYGN